MRQSILLFALLLTLTGFFTANFPAVHAATLTVGPPGSGAQYPSINNAVSAASPGDLIQVWPGSYQESVSISKTISLVSRDGPSVTVIAPTTAAACVRVTTNSVTVSGFTVQGGLMGIQLASSSYSTVTNNIANDNGIPAPHGHGFDIEGGGQNVITNNLAKNSYANGFYFYQTNGNYVYNNKVIKKNPTDTYSTQTQHAFAFAASNNNLVIGNLADSSYWTGFLFLTGSSSNTVVQNTAQYNRVDGIVFTDVSRSNYVAQNTITSNGMTGLWLNGGSDFNWVTGNSIQGQGEVGIAVYASSWNTIEYNQVFNNIQAGIYLWSSSGAPPQYNTIQWNAVYENKYKGIFLQGASATRIIGNYIHGRTSWSDDLAIYITNGNNNEVFENTLTDFQFANFYLNTPGSGNILYHNNAFGSVTNYDYQGSTWDRGATIGGNYWQSYSGFIGSSAQDHYPFLSENVWQQPSVSITSPLGGEEWATGTAKAIRWTARGVVYVDLYSSTGSGWTLLASNLANIGYYLWTLPPSPAATVTIRVDGKNSAGTVTATASNPTSFSIPASTVSLTYPSSNGRLTASSTATVRWTSSQSVVKVNLAYNCGSGWQSIANSLVNTGSYDWALPGTAASACFLKAQGFDSGDNQIGSDQNDFPFEIVPSSPNVVILSPVAGESLQIGSGHLVRWLSSCSSYVDVYFDPGSGLTLLSTVQDTGRYYWTIPNTPSTTAILRVDGRSSSGTILASGTSDQLTIAQPKALTLENLGNQMINGVTDSVIFVYPDTTAAGKPPGMYGALYTDWVAIGIPIGLANSRQYESRDTNTGLPLYVNSATGQPGASGMTIVTVGGRAVHSVVHWLEVEPSGSISPVYYGGVIGGNYVFIRRSDGAIVASQPGENPSYDTFVIYTAQDSSNNVYYVFYGIQWSGSMASTHKLLQWVQEGQLGSQTQTWQIWRWDDTNGDGMANPAPIDTYTLLASG